MLIATFGANTGWAGKTITYENEAFVFEGYGSIRAADVMEYDRQGHLVWVNDGTRAWAGAVAKKEGLVSPVAAEGPSLGPKDSNPQPWWRRPNYIIPLVVGVALAAIVLVVALSVLNTQATKRAAAKEAARAATAQRAAAAKTAAAQAMAPFLQLDAALDVGIVFADYTKRVQEAQYALNSYQPTDAKGLRIKDHLTKAAAQYAAALTNWNSYIQNQTPQGMQSYWANASAELDQAKAEQ